MNKEVEDEALPTEMKYSWRGALKGALGGATTAFVAMEASNLIAKYILGQELIIEPVATAASVFGAFMVAARGIGPGLCLDNEKIPLGKRLKRSLIMGSIYGGFAGGMLGLLGYASGTSSSLDIFRTTQAQVLGGSFMASFGIVDGWYNVVGARGFGFRLFKD